jgi:hypothetical protein
MKQSVFALLFRLNFVAAEMTLFFSEITSRDVTMACTQLCLADRTSYIDTFWPIDWGFCRKWMGKRRIGTPCSSAGLDVMRVVPRQSGSIKYCVYCMQQLRIHIIPYFLPCLYACFVYRSSLGHQAATDPFEQHQQTLATLQETFLITNPHVLIFMK